MKFLSSILKSIFSISNLQSAGIFLFFASIWMISGFFVENGWGGRIIDPSTWVPHETNEGPSFWGHERLYLPDVERLKFRKKRLETAEQGKQSPMIIDCPWLYQNVKNK